MPSRIMKRHPSETTVLRRDGRYVRRSLRQAEPEPLGDIKWCAACGRRHFVRRHIDPWPEDDRITPLKLIGLTLSVLWLWLAVGALLFVVMGS